MKRPDSIQIGPHEWTVLWDKNAIVRESRSSGQDKLGQTEEVNMTIMIDPDRPATALRDTFVHEMLHAIHWTVNVDALLNTAMRNGPDDANVAHLEESLTGLMCTIMLDTLRRNPDVVKWLMEDAK